ncbi:MAG: hypothetical protein ACREIM_01150 [Nitrospiraceae bacterium]
MRVTSALLLISAFLMCAATAGAADLGGLTAYGTHYGFSGVVSKIESGFLFIKSPHGLQLRAISPNKADRVGLHDAKIGDEILLLVDSGNVLLDATTPTRMAMFEHRLLTGRIDYGDPYWGEIRLSTPEGTERFDVDSLMGNKLWAYEQGSPVVIELDADNVMIDIHRDR